MQVIRNKKSRIYAPLMAVALYASVSPIPLHAQNYKSKVPTVEVNLGVIGQLAGTEDYYPQADAPVQLAEEQPNEDIAKQTANVTDETQQETIFGNLFGGGDGKKTAEKQKVVVESLPKTLSDEVVEVEEEAEEFAITREGEVERIPIIIRGEDTIPNEEILDPITPVEISEPSESDDVETQVVEVKAPEDRTVEKSHTLLDVFKDKFNVANWFKGKSEEQKKDDILVESDVTVTGSIEAGEVAANDLEPIVPSQDDSEDFEEMIVIEAPSKDDLGGHLVAGEDYKKMDQELEIAANEEAEARSSFWDIFKPSKPEVSKKDVGAQDDPNKTVVFNDGSDAAEELVVIDGARRNVIPSKLPEAKLPVDAPSKEVALQGQSLEGTAVQIILPNEVDIEENVVMEIPQPVLRPYSILGETLEPIVTAARPEAPKSSDKEDAFVEKVGEKEVAQEVKVSKVVESKPVEPISTESLLPKVIEQEVEKAVPSVEAQVGELVSVPDAFPEPVTLAEVQEATQNQAAIEEVEEAPQIPQVAAVVPTEIVDPQPDVENQVKEEVASNDGEGKEDSSIFSQITGWFDDVVDSDDAEQDMADVEVGASEDEFVDVAASQEVQEGSNIEPSRFALREAPEIPNILPANPQEIVAADALVASNEIVLPESAAEQIAKTAKSEVIEEKNIEIAVAKLDEAAPAAGMAADTALNMVTKEVIEPLATDETLEVVDKLAADTVTKITSFLPNEDGVVLTLGFDQADIVISDEDSARLTQLVEHVSKDSDKRLKIVSYASDAEGRANSSRRIALQRAIAIRSQIIRNGLESMRINVQAMGNKNNDGEPDRADLYLVGG